MGMVDWFILLRGIALGLLLGMILVIWLRFPTVYALRLLAGFFLCICGYLLAPVLYGLNWGFYVAVAFSNASVPLFILLVQALFEDHQQPDRATLCFGALYLIASYIDIVLQFGLQIPIDWLHLLVRLAMLGGALFALMLVVRHWQEDLVEVRRRLRLAVLVIAGGYVLGVTLVESLYDAGGAAIPEWVEIANSAGIVLSIALFAGVALKLGAAGLLPAVQATAPLIDHSAPDPELSKLLDKMEQGKLHRDMELTIRAMAAQVGVAEHRLRKLINQNLEYRNFNDFLNHYRLAEVTDRLASPADASIPILTIAMDAGYRSMTTFNRAFRAAYGKTPSEYRRLHCPISDKS
jgi:AraC-like DNA-binding protein